MPDELARWGTEQVLALAPDASSRQAGRSLGTPGRWHDTGHADQPPSVWGYCQGSGKTPYQTCVDLTEPAYRCSCPSRKFPCKHALGLLLLWSAGNVAAADPPAWVTDWQTERAGRKERAAARVRPGEAGDGGDGGDGGAASASAARTQARRAERVEAGVTELERWLSDQVRQGIAGAGRAGYQHWDTMAARLVDAQAPGLASGVRRLASVATMPDRLLTELSLLRLVVTAHRRRDQIPADLAATVRSRIGFPVATEGVLAGVPVTDEWTVIGIRDEMDERLSLRRAWLRATTTGQDALILSFAPAGTPLPADLVLGTSLDADLCFYPGRGNLRALVKERRSEPRPVADPPQASGSVNEALRRYADALGADPWLERCPMLLGAVTIVNAAQVRAPAGTGSPPDRDGGGWCVVDRAGSALPLNLWAASPWRLHAAGGGAPATLAGEWGMDGLRPLAMWVDGRLVRP
jgi:hypothetical protein